MNKLIISINDLNYCFNSIQNITEVEVTVTLPRSIKLKDTDVELQTLVTFVKSENGAWILKTPSQIVNKY